MTQQQDSRVFGKRATQHTIIIASGSRIRHMTVKPWALALAGCFVAVFVIGYLMATTYLVLRDDLIGATMARQARMQHAYEDRIAALRAQVDRVTSRQLLDQQLMEDKVETLIAQQAALSSRHGRLDTLIERAETGAVRSLDAPLPTPRPAFAPEKRASLDGGALEAIASLTASATAEKSASPTPNLAPGLMAYAPLRETTSERADRVFSEVTLSLRSIEQQQMDRIRTLTTDTFETADAIEDILRETGLDVPEGAPEATGGPLLNARNPAEVDAFDHSLDHLDEALLRLESVREHATRMPLSHPAPGKQMTSRYGNRKDPFLNRQAFHSGIDFRVGYGEPVIAAGDGTVITAGRNGGYGKMIEIRHVDGITTRYAHLDRIGVQKGQTITAGERIGDAGSTGRSTGAHLHYEVRLDGQTVDPARFLRAGVSLKPYLQP